MKYRITDDRLPGEELIIEPRSEDLDDVDDGPLLSEREAFTVIEFWESSTEVAARGSYDLTEDGIIVLGEVQSVGDDIEMMAWYQGDVDYPLAGFPCNTLHYEEVVEQERPKKFSELRSYPGMNGIPVTPSEEVES